MACTIHPTGAGFGIPRAMTRCECAEVDFHEVAARIERDGRAEALRRTGCGGNCTACLPDLEAFLAARAAR